MAEPDRHSSRSKRKGAAAKPSLRRPALDSAAPARRPVKRLEVADERMLSRCVAVTVDSQNAARNGGARVDFSLLCGLDKSDVAIPPPEKRFWRRTIPPTAGRWDFEFAVSLIDVTMELVGMTAPESGRAHLREADVSRKYERVVSDKSTDGTTRDLGGEAGMTGLAGNAKVTAGSKRQKAKELGLQVTETDRILKVRTYGPATEPHWRVENRLGQALEDKHRGGALIEIGENAADSRFLVTTLPRGITVDVTSERYPHLSEKEQGFVSSAARKQVLRYDGSAFVIYRAVLRPNARAVT